MKLKDGAAGKTESVKKWEMRDGATEGSAVRDRSSSPKPPPEAAATATRSRSPHESAAAESAQTTRRGSRALQTATTARKGNDEYLMAALELGDTEFLGYFERTRPELYRRYETLCRDNGKLEEFRANPLVFILANQPECCTHVAKRFIDGPDAAPATSAAPPGAQAAGAARSRSRSPHGNATATAQTTRRGSRATLPMFDGHDPRWKKG